MIKMCSSTEEIKLNIFTSLEKKIKINKEAIFREQGGKKGVRESEKEGREEVTVIAVICA